MIIDSYKYQVMPDLAPDEYAELKADIEARGVMVPIEFDEFGNVLDGHHRLRACEELGITDYPKVVRAGWTEQEKRNHARKLNLVRRMLNREQKQLIIRDALKESPEKSDRQHAEDLGVDHKTISAQRKELESRGEIPHIETSTDTLGRIQPRQRKPVTIFNPSESEKIALKNPEMVEKAIEEEKPLMQVFRESAPDRKRLDEMQMQRVEQRVEERQQEIEESPITDLNLIREQRDDIAFLRQQRAHEYNSMFRKIEKLLESFCEQSDEDMAYSFCYSQVDKADFSKALTMREYNRFVEQTDRIKKAIMEGVNG